MAMDIGKLQRQAASSVDELLEISGDMDTYVIAAYGSATQEVVAMQCRIQLERLRRLEKKLTEIRHALAEAAGAASCQPGLTELPGISAGAASCQPVSTEPPRMAAREGLSAERQSSIAVTEQMIAQNLLMIAQKEELLNGFLTHSDMVGAQLKHARELNDTAEIIRLKNILRGESASCRTENER